MHMYHMYMYADHNKKRGHAFEREQGGYTGGHGRKKRKGEWIEL